MMKTKLLLAASCLFCLCATHAQTVHTPVAGSAERKAMMDALRVPFEKVLRQKVIFRVRTLRVAGDWALAQADPTRPDGGAIDYARTKYRQDFENGSFSGEGEALLHRVDGKWSVIEWRLGAGELHPPEWLEKHGAPKTLQP